MAENGSNVMGPAWWAAQIAELRGRANWAYIAAEQRDMRKSWHALIGHFAGPEIAGNEQGTAAWRWYESLEAAYGTADRHYHNLAHVGQMLSWIGYVWGGTWETCLIAKFAAWFHDAVYDSKAMDSEERSAGLALKAAGELGVTPEIAGPAADWILRTKGHDAGGSMECGMFLDCDLAILGAPKELYRNYVAAIRKEYAWVAQDAYRKGRSQLLAGFLDRDRIYAIDQMAKKLEVQARWNLQNEIRWLEDGSI